MLVTHIGRSGIWLRGLTAQIADPLQRNLPVPAGSAALGAWASPSQTCIQLAGKVGKWSILHVAVAKSPFQIYLVVSFSVLKWTTLMWGFFVLLASSFNSALHSFTIGLTASLDSQRLWRATIKKELLSQVSFLDREYYLDLSSCSKPVIKTSKEPRCITMTGKRVLFNNAHIIRVSKKRCCTLKYTNLWLMEWITKVHISHFSHLSHSLFVQATSLKMCYMTHLCPVHRGCAFTTAGNSVSFCISC